MNKVSNHFRHVATYINSDDVRTTTYKYAELVERLVKAAEAVRDSDHCECQKCVELFSRLDDAIEAIKLPKETPNGK